MKKTIVFALWAFFMFIAPIGIIVTEFVVLEGEQNTEGLRVTLAGAFFLGLLFLAYKRLVVARYVNQDTPIARFVRTMDAILPLLIFAVLTVWFGDWLRHIGGVVGMVWTSLAIGSIIGLLKGGSDE